MGRSFAWQSMTKFTGVDRHQLMPRIPATAPNGNP
jgi:hypothetical protein